MTHKAIIETHPDVMMDDCHIDIIHALILAAKPQTVLEIGVGTGATTTAILRAVESNSNGAKVTLVDGFNDWYFVEPEGFTKIRPLLEFIESQECEFVLAASQEGRKFDFIVSDADHAHTGEWAKETASLVSDGGILIYHDVTPACPSVSHAAEVARASGMSSMIFNKSSHPWERCERALCVLQKRL